MTMINRNNFWYRVGVLPFFFLSLMFFPTCATEIGNPDTPDDETMIQGLVSKGPIAYATIRIYRLDQSGRMDPEPVWSTSSDVAGLFRFPERLLQEPVLVRSYGGSYHDEATGITLSVPGGLILEAIQWKSGGDIRLAVTPVSSMVAERVRALLAQSKSYAEADAQARSEAAQIFQISSLDLQDLPSDLTDPGSCTDLTGKKRYGSLLAGFSQWVVDKSVDHEHLYTTLEALRQDFGDGDITNLRDRDGNTITVVYQTPPSQLISDLPTSVDTFLDSPKNKSCYQR